MARILGAGLPSGSTSVPGCEPAGGLLCATRSFLRRCFLGGLFSGFVFELFEESSTRGRGWQVLGSATIWRRVPRSRPGATSVRHLLVAPVPTAHVSRLSFPLLLIGLASACSKLEPSQSVNDPSSKRPERTRTIENAGVRIEVTGLVGYESETTFDGQRASSSSARIN